MNVDPGQVANSGGVIGLLALAVWGAWKEFWVPGSRYRAALREKDYWRTIALDGVLLTHKTVATIEPLVGRADPGRPNG